MERKRLDLGLDDIEKQVLFSDQMFFQAPIPAQFFHAIHGVKMQTDVVVQAEQREHDHVDLIIKSVESIAVKEEKR